MEIYLESIILDIKSKILHNILHCIMKEWMVIKAVQVKLTELYLLMSTARIINWITNCLTIDQLNYNILSPLSTLKFEEQNLTWFGLYIAKLWCVCVSQLCECVHEEILISRDHTNTSEQSQTKTTILNNWPNNKFIESSIMQLHKYQNIIL